MSKFLRKKKQGFHIFALISNKKEINAPMWVLAKPALSPEG